jgi:hypothetical protein
MLMTKKKYWINQKEWIIWAARKLDGSGDPVVFDTTFFTETYNNSDQDLQLPRLWRPPDSSIIEIDVPQRLAAKIAGCEEAAIYGHPRNSSVRTKP